MIELIFQALTAGLSLWSGKDKTKYQDRLISLRQEYYEEIKKPVGVRSDAVLDNIEFELRNLTTGFASSVGK